LRRVTSEIWDEAGIDVLVVPTASITPTIREVMDVPIGINTILGYYTNFCNLLDLSVMAVPNGFLPNGMPTGISLIGRAFDDELLFKIARLFEQARSLPLGASGKRDEASAPPPALDFRRKASPDEVQLAVVGSHMGGLNPSFFFPLFFLRTTNLGLPLNGQLLALHASLVSKSKTKPVYQLFDITQPGDKVVQNDFVLFFLCISLISRTTFLYFFFVVNVIQVISDFLFHHFTFFLFSRFLVLG
jgi:hypothetical protein